MIFQERIYSKNTLVIQPRARGGVAHAAGIKRKAIDARIKQGEKGRGVRSRLEKSQNVAKRRKTSKKVATRFLPQESVVGRPNKNKY